MSKTSLHALRKRFDRPVGDYGHETLVGVAVAIWTFGQLVFTHATVGQLPFAREFSLGVCCASVALGCLVAAIASRQFEFEPAGLAGLGIFLFVAITVWNKLRSPRLLVLLLLIVAARQMNVRRLLRFYVGGAVAALFVVAVLAVLGVTTINLNPSIGFGFANAKTVACLLMGIVAAICISEDRRGMRVPCAVLCLLCVVVTMFVLRVRSYAVFMALMGVCVLGRDVLARFAAGLMVHREFSSFVAALPIVLFCLSQDATKFYPFASFVNGGYKSILSQYGFATLCCMAMVYVRAVLLASREQHTVLAWALLCIYLLVCVREANVTLLEFNGMLLFFALGMNKGVLGLDEPKTYSSARGE